MKMEKLFFWFSMFYNRPSHGEVLELSMQLALSSLEIIQTHFYQFEDRWAYCLGRDNTQWACFKPCCLCLPFREIYHMVWLNLMRKDISHLAFRVVIPLCCKTSTTSIWVITWHDLNTGEMTHSDLYNHTVLWDVLLQITSTPPGLWH